MRPLDAFGDRSLADLGRSVADIAAWQATLPDGYRTKILGAFSQVLDRAVAWKLVSENPVRLARTGKRRVARRREIEPFTRPEIDRVAAELGPLYGPMVVFASETGLRPGELAALEQRDIDRDPGVVCVRRVISGGRVKEPKTELSRRRVPLTARAAAALDLLPRRLDTRLVFPSPRGGVLDMHNFARRDWHPPSSPGDCLLTASTTYAIPSPLTRSPPGSRSTNSPATWAPPSGCLKCITRTWSGTQRRRPGRSSTRTPLRVRRGTTSLRGCRF